MVPPAARTHPFAVFAAVASLMAQAGTRAVSSFWEMFAGMKVLLVPLLSFALLQAGLSQLPPPDNLDKSESESVDAATDKAVRGFFKQLETAYNNHKSHRIASFFAEDGIWKTPEGNFTGPDEIEEHVENFDFKHWHLRDEVITVNEIQAPLGGNLIAVNGTWSNTVSSNKAAEGGGTPIPLHGSWNAFLLPDGKGSYSITLNSFDVLQ
jgi:uncharacterized protein (TIGR02246 family)